METLDILVLEENKGHQNLIKKILSKYTFVRKMEFSSNVGEAVHFLRNDFFNAIITEYKFIQENLSGLDFLRYIKEEQFNIPSIILTGAENEIDSTEALGYGCISVVSKFGYHEDGTLEHALNELRKRALYRSFENKGGLYVPATVDGTFKQIPFVEIILIEAKVRGRTIYTDTDSVKTDNYLKEYEGFLAPYYFGKVSRNHLVNLARIKEFDGKMIHFHRNIHNFNTLKVTEKSFDKYWEKYLMDCS
ncbi:LytR/AlgR family response regulator transcription factor [Brevibacillus laterosporus]|uniref:LytR/AlgR family response regulator transcription factor n=1 Tax=Brevibacillus laterosporus TaxID=1465 RepID=UPI000E6CADD7|nr:DNA-binding response regulator [Brevibacillus laterosporus]AYB39713.1 DNA-binding response regulator [Brevibacillus laterosporus]MBM7109142.1 LytTr DNA-binding domain protein [Brevibacillus laterosporus]